MKLNSYFKAVLLGFFLMFTNAEAAFLDVTLSPSVKAGTLNLLSGKKAVTVNFSGTSFVEQIWFSNDQNGDLPNQSPDDIRTSVENKFGVTGLVNVADGLISGNSASISTANPFSYLAIHFGKYELFFKFLTSTTDFQISTNGSAAGLSNFRTYDARPSSVPVPGAVWLFGSALLSLAGLKRKKAS